MVTVAISTCVGLSTLYCISLTLVYGWLKTNSTSTRCHLVTDASQANGALVEEGNGKPLQMKSMWLQYTAKKRQWPSLRPLYRKNFGQYLDLCICFSLVRPTNAFQKRMRELFRDTRLFLFSINERYEKHRFWPFLASSCLIWMMSQNDQTLLYCVIKLA